MPVFDWSNDKLRKEYEDELSHHRRMKIEWPWYKLVLWFSGVIGFPALLAASFYGAVSYEMRKDALNEKTEKEAEMKAVCFFNY